MSVPQTSDFSDQGIGALGAATIRLRSDIQWIAYPDTGRWVAMDPIANAFYYFSSLEHQAAMLLDGNRSLGQVFELIQRTCIHAQISGSWIERFVQKLFRSQLLEAPQGFQSGRLPVGIQQASFFRSLVSNPLSIRIPLFRPSIDYRWAHWIARAVLSTTAMGVLAVGLILVSYLVASKLIGSPNELLYDVGKIQGDRWLVLAALLVAIKSIHELGHYLACVKLKVRCAEVGALFLCFTPCLYCDTTESWRLPSRWQRAMIAAAGIYFELWIALIGGLIFLNTSGGFIHVLGGGIWLMCTLGTLILNANPFFRYDGYFILSDLLRAPNLGAQSSTALWETLVSALGGRRPNREAYDLPVGWLSAFAFVSMLYRWMVLGSIIYFLWHFLVPAGLGLYFLAVISATLLGVARNSIVQSQALVAELFAPKPISPWRFFAFVSLIAVALFIALFFPLPSHAIHRGYIEYSDSKPIYAPEDGLVKEVGKWAQSDSRAISSPGELIVLLEQPELELERIQQQHEYRQLESRVEIYKQAAINDESLASDIPTLEEMKGEAFSKLQLLEQRLDKLQLSSPSSGRFVPKIGWNPAGYSQGELMRVWQPVLTHADRAKRFKRGELIGWFTEKSQSEAIVLVSAETIRSINMQTRVSLVSDASPAQEVNGKILYFSNDPIPVFPTELEGDPMFVLQRDERGLLQSDVPLYRVRIEFSGVLDASSRGGLCSARFELPKLTLADRLYRFVSAEFKTN